MPITVAFATFHFKHLLKIICNIYQFKNYMIIISYIFCIISYKNKVENELPQNNIGKTSVRVATTLYCNTQSHLHYEISVEMVALCVSK